MPWAERRLRGQIVLAKVNEQGEPLVEGGRVEIRYKPNDGRAYGASPRNLERLPSGATFPDEHCAPAERPAPKAERAVAKQSSAGRAAPGKSDGASAGSATHAHAESAHAQKHPSHGKGSAAEVVVYADGACTGNPGPAGLGVVIQHDGMTRELSEYLGQGTNNIGELTAVLRAAQALSHEKRAIEIKTDSKYAIGVLTQGWKAKANQALIAEVKAALAKLPKVRLSYVPGHAGVPGNERADKLAREAVSRRATTEWTER
jgi:ribonuclease HI